MRLDDFDPNAVDIEDQRGGGGCGMGGMRLPIGGRRRQDGLRHDGDRADRALGVLGVDPSQMIGGLEQVQQQSPPAAAGRSAGRRQSAAKAAPSMRPASETCNALSSLNKTWEPVFQQSNIALPAAQAGVLFADGPIGLRRGAERDGAVLLPRRPRHLHRHRFLPQMEQELGASGQFARDLCDRPRIWPPHPEADRHVRSGAQRCSRKTRAGPTSSRCGSNCRRIAMPGSGPPGTATGWSRATWKAGSTPRIRSATTR